MEELSKKTLPELRDMAKALNIKSVTKYKKNDLIELIKDNSNDNKEDNTAKDSDEHVKKQNIKAEQQKIEKKIQTITEIDISIEIMIRKILDRVKKQIMHLM